MFLHRFNDCTSVIDIFFRQNREHVDQRLAVDGQVRQTRGVLFRNFFCHVEREILSSPSA